MEKIQYSKKETDLINEVDIPDVQQNELHYQKSLTRITKLCIPRAVDPKYRRHVLTRENKTILNIPTVLDPEIRVKQ